MAKTIIMAKIPEEIENRIPNFIRYLNSNGILIDRAYLFGSYAKGNYDEWSDIDLALISDKFEGNRYKDLDKLTDALIKIDTDISPLPYTHKDFTSDDLFVKEILNTGVRVY